MTLQERLFPEHDAPSAFRRAVAYAGEHRYLILAGLVFLAMVSHVLNGRWAAGTDIWEHADAARQLGAHPLHPRHPLFLLDRPHQFYSPYHLAVGLFSRFSGLSIMTALNIAGLVNVALLLVGLRLFLDRLVPRRHTAFWALLFILFLWGHNPWFFSGFLHWNVLGLVMTYPSTFSKAVVFLALAAHLQFLRSRDSRWLLAMVGASFVIVLAHPIDAVFLWITAGAVCIGIPDLGNWRARALVLTALAAAVGLLLAFLWPYYSLRDLTWGADNAAYRRGFASGDHDMYLRVLSRIFPALIAVPFIFWRQYRAPFDPLVLTFAGLFAVYEYGSLSENWPYGRTISALMIIGLMILADGRAAAGEAIEGVNKIGPPGRMMVFWLRISTIGLVLLGAFYVRNGFMVLPRALTKELPYAWVHSDVDLAKLDDWAFLGKFLHENDVVVADLYTSLEVPAFGAKVVAVPRPEAFVDTSKPGSDIGTFFDPKATDDQRRTIIRRYRARFLLLKQDRLASDRATGTKLLALGRVVHKNERFVLLDLR